MALVAVLALMVTSLAFFALRPHDDALIPAAGPSPSPTAQPTMDPADAALFARFADVWSGVQTSLADVREASAVLRGALPGSFAVLGPIVFTIGLFTAAMTTLVVAAQVTVYFILDMLGLDWRFTAGNRRYHVLLAVFVLAAAALAPLWDFPALLKVILLMGVNVAVIPIVYVIVIALSNSRTVMREVTPEPWRNAILVLGLLASLLLAVDKAPGYVRLLFG